MNNKKNLFIKLFLLFTIIPIIEVFLLFKISDATNWFFTILLVITTGLVGAYLAKKEGYNVLLQFKTNISIGVIPKEELINGICILIGSIFLITPGILTDLAGFSLILPLTRVFYCNIIKKWTYNHMNII
jgi:UPF0716 protein FxsA